MQPRTQSQQQIKQLLARPCQLNDHWKRVDRQDRNQRVMGIGSAKGAASISERAIFGILATYKPEASGWRPWVKVQPDVS
jgi:hypothetical protein